MSCEQTVKVVLHGYLKKLYPHDILISGSTVAEILNGMCRLTKAFEPKLGAEKHTVSVVGFNTEEEIYKVLSPSITEIHLVPALCGGKSGGFFRIFVGALLVAAAVFMPATLGTLGPLGSIGATSGSLGLLGNFGLSLVLGGLMEMLSPAPKKDSSNAGANDPEASKYLGASQNTVKIGTRIPLMYGLNKAGGHYLSFDVDAKDVAL